MRRRARIRLLVVLVVLGLPALVVVGLGWYIGTGRLARDLASAWDDLGSNTRLEVDDIALAALEQVVVGGVRIDADEGVLMAARGLVLDGSLAERALRRVAIDRLDLHLDARLLPAWLRIVRALESRGGGDGDARHPLDLAVATAAVRLGQLRVDGLTIEARRGPDGQRLVVRRSGRELLELVSGFDGRQRLHSELTAVPGHQVAEELDLLGLLPAAAGPWLGELPAVVSATATAAVDGPGRLAVAATVRPHRPWRGLISAVEVTGTMANGSTRATLDLLRSDQAPLTLDLTTGPTTALASGPTTAALGLVRARLDTAPWLAAFAADLERLGFKTPVDLLPRALILDHSRLEQAGEAVSFDLRLAPDPAWQEVSTLRLRGQRAAGAVEAEAELGFVLGRPWRFDLAFREAADWSVVARSLPVETGFLVRRAVALAMAGHLGPGLGTIDLARLATTTEIVASLPPRIDLDGSRASALADGGIGLEARFAWDTGSASAAVTRTAAGHLALDSGFLDDHDWGSVSDLTVETTPTGITAGWQSWRPGPQTRQRLFGHLGPAGATAAGLLTRLAEGLPQGTLVLKSDRAHLELGGRGPMLLARTGADGGLVVTLEDLPLAFLSAVLPGLTVAGGTLERLHFEMAEPTAASRLEVVHIEIDRPRLAWRGWSADLPRLALTARSTAAGGLVVNVTADPVLTGLRFEVEDDEVVASWDGLDLAGVADTITTWPTDLRWAGRLCQRLAGRSSGRLTLGLEEGRLASGEVRSHFQDGAFGQRLGGLDVTLDGHWQRAAVAGQAWALSGQLASGVVRHGGWRADLGELDLTWEATGGWLDGRLAVERYRATAHPPDRSEPARLGFSGWFEPSGPRAKGQLVFAAVDAGWHHLLPEGLGLPPMHDAQGPVSAVLDLHLPDARRLGIGGHLLLEGVDVSIGFGGVLLQGLAGTIPLPAQWLPLADLF